MSSEVFALYVLKESTQVNGLLKTADPLLLSLWHYDVSHTIAPENYLILSVTGKLFKVSAYIKQAT